MALKSGEKTAVLASDPSQHEPVDNGVALELAMYVNYSWGGVTYHKGTAYKFTREDAMALMAEEDHGRPIWRKHVPPKPKGQVRMPIVDSTEVRAVRTRQSLEEASLMGTPGQHMPKRIDVGTDDEIADLLPDVDSTGDVTV